MSPSLRRLLALHDDVVAVEDPGLDHALPLHAEQELLAAARERVRHGQMVLDVLLGEQRPSGCDLADDWQHAHLAHVGYGHGGSGRRALAFHELERPRLRRVAAQVSRALEVGQVGVHGRRRGKPDGLSDLAHGGRIAVSNRRS